MDILIETIRCDHEMALCDRTLCLKYKNSFLILLKYRLFAIFNYDFLTNS
ncbi:MAG: hypothetical protein ACXITR_07025 [Cyanobacterium sp.]